MMTARGTTIEARDDRVRPPTRALYRRMPDPVAAG
jgi:hypothetical protein